MFMVNKQDVVVKKTKQPSRDNCQQIKHVENNSQKQEVII